MQIVKSEYNNQPRKDEETHLRKYESPRKHGTIVKKRPNSSAPLRWGGVVANVMAGRHHGCSGVITFATFVAYQILSSFYTQIMPLLAYYSEAEQASGEASPSQVHPRGLIFLVFLFFFFSFFFI